MTKPVKNVKRYVLVVLIILTVAFIWSNSARNAETSSNDSSQIVDIVKPVVDPDDSIERDSFVHFIRKAAHFAEFGLLGFELCLLTLTHDKKKLPLPVSVVGTVLVATTDELIQLTSPGRSAAVTDVLIDTAGGFCGALLALLAVFIIKRIRKKFLSSKLDVVEK